MHLRFTLGLIFGLVCTLLPARAVELSTAAGVSVSIDPADGRYKIRAAQPGWTLAGETGEPLDQVGTRAGRDAVGAFHELRFTGKNHRMWSGAIRCYDEAPVVLFVSTLSEAAETLPVAFPRFTTLPEHLYHFSYQEKVFSPPAFTLETTSSPWLFFNDHDDAMILSPAANFMVARMSTDGGTLISGLNPELKQLPAGFSHRTVLVLGHGINATWDRWGHALTDWAGKRRPANDTDIGLRYLGYWTDNGAVYYYNYDRSLGYAGTLEQLVKHYREEQIPIRYLQLDSWWYYKTLISPDGKTGRPKVATLPQEEWNRYGGLIKYEAHPGVFPHGLAAFQREVNLPLITHNRWIDPESPYHQRYKISGVAAVDPRWWQDIMGYIADAGVVCYEQDWLNEIYKHSPDFARTLNTGAAFTAAMANAAQARGLSVQYCMPLPCYFLQGAAYPNLTTIRTSGDRFERKKWDHFLFTSRLAASVGIWPWTDVFMSTENDNLLIATLSAGMVGIGDEIGRESKQALFQAVRADGVIVKPDTSLVPTDETYLGDAQKRRAPMVAWAETEHGNIRTAYVFAYPRPGGKSDGEFTPARLGFSGDVVVYEPRTKELKRVAADIPVEFQFGAEGNASRFYEVAPVSAEGVSLLGDEDKFVATGRQRLKAIDVSEDRLSATILFAAGEKSVRIHGYAKARPRIAATSGQCTDIRYDQVTGHFVATVSPVAAAAGQKDRDPVQKAVVTITH